MNGTFEREQAMLGYVTRIRINTVHSRKIEQMPASSELNIIKFVGELSAEENLRLLAAMHSTVDKKGFKDVTLDFSLCTKAFTPQMLPLCSKFQYYWHMGIDVSLIWQLNAQ